MLFHEIDFLRLPVVLKNMVRALKKYSIMVVFDFQEPYEREKYVVVSTAEDIRHILGKIC